MGRTEWADFFNDHAPIYDDNCFTKNTLNEVDFLIRELEMPPGASVLDIGCGTGRHSVELARRGFKVTGIDISSGMLEQARKRAEAAQVNVTFHQADATCFTSDTQYDFVICLCEGSFGLLGTGGDAIEQPLSILRNASAAMKPGAKCLFTVLNGFRQIRQFTMGDVEQGKYCPMTLTELSDCSLPGVSGPTPLRERGFVPTELRLLFTLAALEVLGIWGGTAGNWGKRPIDLDEMEIMILGQKTPSS